MILQPGFLIDCVQCVWVCVSVCVCVCQTDSLKQLTVSLNYHHLPSAQWPIIHVLVFIRTIRTGHKAVWARFSWRNDRFAVDILYDALLQKLWVNAFLNLFPLWIWRLWDFGFWFWKGQFKVQEVNILKLLPVFPCMIVKIKQNLFVHKVGLEETFFNLYLSRIVSLRASPKLHLFIPGSSPEQSEVKVVEMRELSLFPLRCSYILKTENNSTIKFKTDSKLHFPAMINQGFLWSFPSLFVWLNLVVSGPEWSSVPCRQ